jgi:hypothetical protein
MTEPRIRPSAIKREEGIEGFVLWMAVLAETAISRA